MFYLLSDYPDSIPVLRDLKFCLQHTRQRPALIHSLKQEITNRVLHPGLDKCFTYFFRTSNKILLSRSEHTKYHHCIHCCCEGTTRT